ncbi:MAG TPA: hemerythrin family protein [Gammaproteobacteria bacterium]
MQPQNLLILDPVNIPQLALESMNKVHREEVVLINQLAALLQQAKDHQADNAAITENLHEWVQHTREHFAGEERLMMDYGFPAYAFHASEHERVMAQIQSLQNQWLDRNEIKPLYEFVFSNWPRWFNDHVNSMDRVTAEFISQRMS